MNLNHYIIVNSVIFYLQIVDPKMPKGYTFNGVPIPKPPGHVLDLQKKFNNPVYLILFFDAKRTW